MLLKNHFSSKSTDIVKKASEYSCRSIVVYLRPNRMTVIHFGRCRTYMMVKSEVALYPFQHFRSQPLSTDLALEHLSKTNYLRLKGDIYCQKKINMISFSFLSTSNLSNYSKQTLLSDNQYI